MVVRCSKNDVSLFSLGIDLVAIKPIKNVTTLQADITTDHCRQVNYYKGILIFIFIFISFSNPLLNSLDLFPWLVIVPNVLIYLMISPFNYSPRLNHL